MGHPVLEQVKKAIREGYAWPGGYELSVLCSDGGILCTGCARAEFRRIVHSTLHQMRDGWRAEGVNVHDGEEPDWCDHCGKELPAPYQDDS